MGKFILFFNEIDKSSLPFVGGKGANLGEMTKSGFPVPQGFCITTFAYKAFAQMSKEMAKFFNQLDEIDINHLDEVRQLGKRIRDHLLDTPIPPDIEDSIIRAWQHFGTEKAYAVRSSATAEDLPTASFAGQQETFLNVRGQIQLIDSIRQCFASLFTDRAITYRAKNGFDHRQVFLSVVVQEMIFPEVSGILFTADPISGNRKITSIDASFGLGEALVSGLVSADLYQVRDGKIIQKKISKKKIGIFSLPDGGTITKELAPSQQETQALTDDQIIHLSELGKKIEAHYGSEQDIEWCFCNDNFYIVQSRPITSLYPVIPITPIMPVSPVKPVKPGTSVSPVIPASDNCLHVFASMGHIQMMTEAMKPLALSIFKTVIPIANEAGGRIFADLTPLLSIRPLRKKIPQILSNMDERMGSAIKEFVSRDDVHLPSRSIPVRKVATFFRKVLKIVRKNLFSSNPEKGRALASKAIVDSVQKCREKVLNSSGQKRIEEIEKGLKFLFLNDLPRVVPYWLTSTLASIMIQKLLQKWLGSSQKFELLNRSLPGNVTSELGLMIGDLADIARHNPQLLQYLQTRTNQNFYDGLKELSQDGQKFYEHFALFMREYGMRCPGEIDITRPRWRETPASLVPAIMSHIRTVGEGEHRAKFDQGARDADAAAQAIIAEVRKNKGSFKAHILSKLIRVYRGLGGLREHHKYLVVQHLDIYRQAILMEAKLLVENGVLHQESDVFYLSLNELSTLLNSQLESKLDGQSKQQIDPHSIEELNNSKMSFGKTNIGKLNIDKLNIHELIADRKKQHEIYMKLTPPRVMTSDGEILTGRRRQMNTPEGALVGTPVSSGVIEGYAKVVLRPEEAKLNPGEIMIAPFTDPGWTPLFHSAKALVMEVGGMMTHGAVVAREYGIPAVVGIDDATRIIKDGTYIRVDGSAGFVQILREPE